MKVRTFWKNKAKDTDFIHDLQKNPDLKNLIKYDAKFNNERKVLFESCLAGVIRINPGVLHASLLKVAQSILPDFLSAFEIIKKSINSNQPSAWLCMEFFNSIYKDSDIFYVYKGYYQDRIDPMMIEDVHHFFCWVQQILSSTNQCDAYSQLIIIRQYGSFFLRPYFHMPQFKELNDGLGMLIVPEGVGNEIKKPLLRELWHKCNFEFRKSEITHSRVNIKNCPRPKLTNQFGIFAQDEYKIPLELSKYIPPLHPHIPGKNVWRVTSSSEFTQRARYQLDMPLISSQGCSIALLLITAIVIGELTKEEIRYFNLNAISYMIGNGHHAFHEFNAVWQALDILYVDGNYASIFPDGLIQSHRALQELQNDFPEFLPDQSNKKLLHITT